METTCYFLKLSNVSIKGWTCTRFEGVISKEKLIVCHTNIINLPSDCIICFDTKKVSHILYVYPPKGFKFKLKTSHNPYIDLKLDSIELIEFTEE